MKSFNNELQVYRNETFTIEKHFENKDGSPYIISSELSNPYLLLTVASSRYEQNNKYVKNYWCSLDDVPRFENTTAVDLKSIMTSASGGTSKYSDWPTVTIASTPSETVVADGYINGQYVSSGVFDDVFYLEDSDGNRTYKYWSFDNTAQTTGSWKVYNFKYAFSFAGTDTSQWIEQNYLYSINLVAGTSMLSYMIELYEDNISTTLPSTYDKYTLYNALIDAGITLPEDLVIDNEIYIFDTSIPLLVPTKLTVLNNLQGGLKYE